MPLIIPPLIFLVVSPPFSVYKIKQYFIVCANTAAECIPGGPEKKRGTGSILKALSLLKFFQIDMIG